MDKDPTAIKKIVITEDSEDFKKIKYLYEKFPDMINLYALGSNFVFSGNALAELYNINISEAEQIKDAFKEYIHNSRIHFPIDNKYKKFLKAMKNEVIPGYWNNYVTQHICICFTVFYNFIDNKEDIINIIEKDVMKTIDDKSNSETEITYFSCLDDLLQFEEYREKVKSWIMLLKLNGKYW